VPQRQLKMNWTDVLRGKVISKWCLTLIEVCNILVVGVASGSLQAAYTQTHSPGRLAWAEGLQLLGAVPYS